MLRRPITFDEKVNARFTRRSQSQCWWWDGSLKEGRPALNLRHVTRYIYEREIAPIPPGMRLVRTDHGPLCRPRKTMCEHFRCVNPWHVRLEPNKGGTYQREVNHELQSSERTAIYKRRFREKRQDKEHSDDNPRQTPSPSEEGLAPQ
jgi:hypothetical protein